LVLALVLVQGLPCVRVAATEQDLDPKVITLAVETALVNEGGVPGHLINVNTRDGVVTLSGWVGNLLANRASR
jgi:osmotically-inducible protein OsmY